MRVAITLEHLWHRVPGGTALASLETLRALLAIPGAPDVVGLAGRHREPPAPAWRPPPSLTMYHHRRLYGPWLYEAWLRARWPRVEAVTGPVDVVHAATIIPPPTRAPLVVTLHDLAFLHEPQHFTRRGVSVFRRSLGAIRRHAAIVVCSSQATFDDAVLAGLDPSRLRVVPLGVRATAPTEGDLRRVRLLYELPDRYVLFVGTVEPRKNLAGLVAGLSQLADPPPLVVVGASGWGGVEQQLRHTHLDIRWTGFVPSGDLPALYAQAAALCMPSLREGYGLPVLEAMAQGTPVVTSGGTATEETAGGAAALVDPRSAADIARGLSEVLTSPEIYQRLGRQRAAACTWDVTARAMLDIYREAAS